MDYTILYVIGIVVGVFIVAIGSKYGRDKGWFTSDDLKFAQTLLGLSIEIIDELDLKQEAEIQKIARVVDTALTQMQLVLNDEATYDQMVNQTYENALKIAEEFDLEMNTQRDKIVLELVQFGVAKLRESN